MNLANGSWRRILLAAASLAATLITAGARWKA
jgi:hypothetical protein